MTTSALPDIENLQAENAKLHLELVSRDQQLIDREQQLVEHQSKIVHLQKQLDWLKKQLFGKKSERIVSDLNPKQLFLEGFEGLNVPVEAPKQPISSHERGPPKRPGQDSISLDPDLPVETVIIDVPEEDKVCKETGFPFVRIGEDVTHKLAARFLLHQRDRPPQICAPSVP